eukprot:SAG11_NODE_1313_length_5225_cov_4.247171_6_plen_64_part_00
MARVPMIATCDTFLELQIRSVIDKLKEIDTEVYSRTSSATRESHDYQPNISQFCQLAPDLVGT